jgi:hypothetical protein
MSRVARDNASSYARTTTPDGGRGDRGKISMLQAKAYIHTRQLTGQQKPDSKAQRGHRDQTPTSWWIRGIGRLKAAHNRRRQAKPLNTHKESADSKKWTVYYVKQSPLKTNKEKRVRLRKQTLLRPSTGSTKTTWEYLQVETVRLPTKPPFEALLLFLQGCSGRTNPLEHSGVYPDPGAGVSVPALSTLSLL